MTALSGTSAAFDPSAARSPIAPSGTACAAPGTAAAARGGSHRQARPRQEIAPRQRRVRARLPVNLLRHRDPPCSCFAAVASACESASSTACLTPAVVMVAPLIASMPAPCAASIMAANLPSRMAS